MVTLISGDLKIEQLHNYERKTLCCNLHGCNLFVLVTAMNVVVLPVKNIGTVPVMSSLPV